MLNVIYGKKGSGKTKRMIRLANESLSGKSGDIIFMDYGSKHMYDLSHEIRFIDVENFKLDNPDKFYGFISGIVAEDTDATLFFIDSFSKMVGNSINEFENLFNKLDKLGEEYNIKFIVCISGDDDKMPEYLQKYLMS